MALEREKISVEIGLRIKELRNAKKLSQEALSFSAGMHPAYLSKIERGEKCPTIDTLYKIAKAFNISLSELVDISGSGATVSDEALFRIKSALNDLPEEKAISVAEIVENIIKIMNK